ncbi:MULTISPECIES: hypothetical protein [Paenibacillus]|uniref:hypothetical protein n=1 Tax=Paenibacillus TaxID=44249 RepID=UPI00131D81A2|nr:hypothetical protein [Paenibacillus glucanolyticus]
MATSSITQNIVIRDKKSSRQLISALENANKKRSVDKPLSKAHREITGDMIKEIFKKS